METAKVGIWEQAEEAEWVGWGWADTETGASNEVQQPTRLTVTAAGKEPGSALTQQFRGPAGQKQQSSLRSQRILQLNQVTGRDVAQQCGNRALAAAITREKAKPQTGECASLPAQHQLTQWQWHCQA